MKLLGLLVLSVCSCARAQNETEAAFLKKLLSGVENLKSKPSEKVTVNSNMYLRTLTSVNIEKNEFAIQLTFRQKWVDKRLTYTAPFKFLVLESENYEQIWRPDTFFQNELTARSHPLQRENALVRIYPDGTILFSQRLSFTFSCLMDARQFPFDSQKCEIMFASYGHTTDGIDYVWKETNPVQQKVGLSSGIPQYTLTNVETGTCTAQTNTGEYACLKVKLEFQRISCQQVIRFYIPTILLLLLSWAPFWIERRNGSLSAGLLFGIGSLIAFLILVNMVVPSAPAVTVTTGLDVWILVNLVLFVGALEVSIFVVWTGVDDYKTRKMDALARLIFPILTAVFNLIYWIVYLAL